MIRKNKKRIDPRYFMDEKTELIKEAIGASEYKGAPYKAPPWNLERLPSGRSLSDIDAGLASALRGGPTGQSPEPLLDAISDFFRVERSQAEQLLKKMLPHARRLEEGKEVAEAYKRGSGALGTMKEAGLGADEISFVNQILDDQIDSADFYDSSAYEKLFQLLAFDWGEMPYGTAKARTGMPDEWILDYLQGLY